MDASSRSTSPSRKSRFRAQSASPRPLEPEEFDGEFDDEVQGYAELPEGETPAGMAAGAAAAFPEEDNIAAGLRLVHSADDLPERKRTPRPYMLSVLAFLILLAGALAGYFIRDAKMDSAQTVLGTSEHGGPVVGLNGPEMAEIDGAFETAKNGRYTEARDEFETLANRHRDWPSMRIESARAALYQGDYDTAKRILANMLREHPNADAEFMYALVQMAAPDYPRAEEAFARCVALDPQRADYFYFWGECLRREGKPQEAAVRFHEALLRNQYETAQGLFQLKFWLSALQIEDPALADTTRSVNEAIDADLKSGHPSGPALFAQAAREIKAEDFKAAADYIGQAQKVMEPAVFVAVLQDPTFLQENYRPEIEPYYKK